MRVDYRCGGDAVADETRSKTSKSKSADHAPLLDFAPRAKLLTDLQSEVWVSLPRRGHIKKPVAFPPRPVFLYSGG
ncbi:hypothetical protein RHIZ404_210653 [Rhizobium sp. EC-SD404]|nr:hypothetical protein RHIZ404_210653 [Rhizobium sp. EC-SD404]